MLSLALSVLFTVMIYVIMRAFPRYGVNAFHAVVFNYYSCVLTGLLLIQDWQQIRTMPLDGAGVQLSFGLGGMFVIVFLLIGLTTQKAGITAATLAGNMSLVIPVIFGLFVFKNTNKDFTLLNYLGLILALVALALGALRKKDGQDRGVGDRSFRSAVWVFPILSFFASGTNNTLINYLTMAYFSPAGNTLFMIIACTGAIAAGTLVILLRYLIKTEKVRLVSIVGGLILGVPNFLSLYFLLRALAEFSNSAALVFPLYNILSMLLSAWIAWLIFKEGLNNFNRLGLLLAVAAIILISYQELGL